MKDEIKEILANAKSKGYIDLDYEESKLLLDYITNLQEENEELIKARYSLDRVELERRIDKAIEKIQYIIDYGFDYDGFNTVESLKGLIDMLVDYARQSKDILQGEDKDE